MTTVTSAKALPRRLLNFFARFPPQVYAQQVGILNTTPAILNSTLTTENAPISDSESSFAAGQKLSRDPSTHPKIDLASAQLLKTHAEHPNPFLPFRNPTTLKWRPPVFSLREQADLVKIATKYGVPELLPPGPKSKEYKEVRYEESGNRVKGTGVGQRVKGHKWERTMKGRLEERKQAMLKMPELIREWRQRGHGRGWKKYPK